MELNEYQKEAMTTCMPTCDNYNYMFANLVGEVGEFASKIAKGIRKGEYIVTDNAIRYADQNPSLEEKLKRMKAQDELRLELGDILWQLSGLCSCFGWSLEGIALDNLDKLASRKARGKIEGDGDNR